MCGAPAVDRITGVLTSAGKQCEHDKEDHGVDVVKTIHPIIVVISLQFIPGSPPGNDSGYPENREK